ncbi:MAG: DUF6111 family protein [Kiloniellaceae bacterium]
MLRKLLTIVLPIALPLLVYLGYLVLARRRARRAGRDRLPRRPEAPWTWIVLSGVALMVAALVTWRMTSGVPPGTRLEPPRLIDGKVVPSHVVE